MGLLRMSRTYARLCYSAGGELEQIQLLLRHRSVEARGGTLQCTPVPTPPSGRRVLSLVFVLKFNDENIAQTSAKLIKRLSLSLVILLASAKNSGGTGARVPSADYSRGTAIFFEWLDDRFVAATDSLETHSNRPPTFDDCKIVKQGTANSFFTISVALGLALIGILRARLRKLMNQYGVQRIQVRWPTNGDASYCYNYSLCPTGIALR